MRVLCNLLDRPLPCLAFRRFPLSRCIQPVAPRSTGGVSRGAFTLTEVIIAIGVIALLAGLLVPTLARAREAANRTQCLSNLRQLGLAFTSYLNDNKGRFPRPAQKGVETPEDWVYYQPWRSARDGALAKYLGEPFNPAMYRCPTDDPASHRKFTHNFLTDAYPYSYSVNEAICRLKWSGPTLRINQIRNPSEKILIIDESAITIDDGCWAWQSSQGGGFNVLANRHDRKSENTSQLRFGRGNAAFVDGHVSYIGREDSFHPRFYDPLLK